MSTVIDENDTTHRLVSVLPVRTAHEGISTVNEKNGLAVSLWSNDASEVISIPYKLKVRSLSTRSDGHKKKQQKKLNVKNMKFVISSTVPFG